MKLAHESKYHVTVLVIYFFFCLYFFLVLKPTSSYFSFHQSDLGVFFILAVFLFASLLIVNRLINYGEITVNKESFYKIMLTILYAGVFSIPEEIIFRGIIQKYLMSVLPDITLAIFLSALIYGVAHLLNGAKSFSPANWSWKLVAMAFIGGIFFGTAYAITGSLVLPIFLHASLIIANQIFIKKKPT